MKLTQPQLEALTSLVKVFDTKGATFKGKHNRYDARNDVHFEEEYTYVRGYDIKVPTRRSTWREVTEVSGPTMSVLSKHGLAICYKGGGRYSGSGEYAPTALGREALAAGGVFTPAAPQPIWRSNETFTPEEEFALKVRRLADERDRYIGSVTQIGKSIAVSLRRKAEEIERMAEREHNTWRSPAEEIGNALVWCVANLGIDRLTREELRLTRAEERLNFLLTGEVRDHDFG